MSVLSVQSVSYSYKTKYQTVQAVKDVSCDLSAGTPVSYTHLTLPTICSV